MSRGVARELAGEPVRFTALPPEELLAELRSTFEKRLELARETARNVAGADQAPSLEPVERLAIGCAHRFARLVCATSRVERAAHARPTVM